VYLNVDFEDVMYECGDAPDFDRSSWLDVKFTLGLDFPNLPYYIDEDVKLTESGAITRYICAKHNPDLLGRTSEELALVEMANNIVGDLKGAVTGPCYATGDKAQIRAAIDSRLPAIEKFLGAKNFLSGANVTFVDFIFFELLYLCDYVTFGAILKDATLAGYIDRMRSLPHIAAYIDGKATTTLAFNNKMAKLGAQPYISCCPIGSHGPPASSYTDCKGIMTTVKLSGNEVQQYEVGPKDSKTVFVFVHDIFDMHAGRCKGLADFLADHGFRVIFPDLHKG